MIAIAVACLPIFFAGHKITRWNGALFLGYYAAYLAYLVLKARDHPSLPAVGLVLGMICIPITFVTILTIAWRDYLASRRTRS